MKKSGFTPIKSGFTLVELLVSITIIGILATIGLGTFTSAQIKSRDTKRKAHLKQLKDAFEAYYNDHGEYPAVEVISWGATFTDARGTVYMVELPVDPSQGLTYVYEPADDGLSFQLYARLENLNDTKSIITFSSPPDCGSSESYDCNYGISSTNTTPEEGR